MKIRELLFEKDDDLSNMEKDYDGPEGKKFTDSIKKLASITAANRMALYLKKNYSFKPSPSHFSSNREIERSGDLPKEKWDKLVRELKALGAKTVKPSKGYERRQMYKLGDLMFNGEYDEEQGGGVGLSLSSPNPKYDNSPYIGRPDE